MLNYFVI